MLLRILFILSFIYLSSLSYGQGDIKSFITSSHDYTIETISGPWGLPKLKVEKDYFELWYMCLHVVYTPHIDHLNGSSDYAILKFKEPLLPGKIYQLKINYTIDDKSIMDNYFPSHIGVALTYNNPMNGYYYIKNVCSSFLKPKEKTEFQYYELNFRPMNEINYLALVTFIDDDEDAYEADLLVEHHIVRILKVEINEVTNPDTTVNIQEYKPKTYKTPPLKRVDFTFQSGQHQLTPDQIKLANDFIGSTSAAYDNKLVYEIHGYTDSVGSIENNIALSEARINSIYNNLKIDKNKVIKIQYPEDKSNQKAVSLQVSSYNIGNVFYTDALKSLNQGDVKGTFALLNKALYTLRKDQLIFILKDPRLNAIKSSKQWQQIVKRVKESYTDEKKPSLAFTLDSLYLEDQYHRSLEFDINGLSIIQNSGKVIIDTIPYEIGVWKHDAEDSLNLIALEKIISKNGWPKISEVGQRPNYAAFLIIQHSRLEILEKYINQLYESCMIGESKLRDWATMYDRIQTYKGSKQKYGTQWKILPSGKLELEPIVDTENISELRKTVGLGPLPLHDIYIKGNIDR